MKIVPGNSVQSPKERILIYGEPKAGKSRLSCCLGNPAYWGEKIAVVAYDPGSENLTSIPKQFRDRLLIVNPTSRDVLEEAVEIATYPWEKDGVGTLVWDTMSITSAKLLQFYAATGVFSEKHGVKMGRQGTKSYHTTPMEGDYGAVQNSIGFLLEHVWQQKVHLIMNFHAKMVTPKPGHTGDTYAGPDVAGREAVRWIPGRFDSVFYLQRIGGGEGQGKIVVNTVPKGIWTAGYRTPERVQSLPERYELMDTEKFWMDYLRSKGMVS